MDPGALRDLIIQKTGELGADAAGICRAGDLLSGPTHRLCPRPEGIEDQHSILVFGLSHPVKEPHLDYFIKREGFRFGNSEGNRRLMDISQRIGCWLEGEEIASRDLHYYVERGGVFLKGAAVLAGLGTIGVNNLLIHPGYGPRIRFRARLVVAEIKASLPLEFDPCSDCGKPCLSVCSEGALDRGGYIAHRCQDRFDRDYEEGIPIPSTGNFPAGRIVHYCRDCEYACSYRGTRET